MVPSRGAVRTDRETLMRKGMSYGCRPTPSPLALVMPRSSS
jgi:hypothetical protein